MLPVAAGGGGGVGVGPLLVRHQVRGGLVPGHQRPPVRPAKVDVEREDGERGLVDVSRLVLIQLVVQGLYVDVSESIHSTESNGLITQRQPLGRDKPPGNAQEALDPARRVISVISLGAKIRNGGPQKPVPRLV